MSATLSTGSDATAPTLQLTSSAAAPITVSKDPATMAMSSEWKQIAKECGIKGKAMRRFKTALCAYYQTHLIELAATATAADAEKTRNDPCDRHGHEGEETEATSTTESVDAASSSNNATHADEGPPPTGPLLTAETCCPKGDKCPYFHGTREELLVSLVERGIDVTTLHTTIGANDQLDQQKEIKKAKSGNRTKSPYMNLTKLGGDGLLAHVNEAAMIHHNSGDASVDVGAALRQNHKTRVCHHYASGLEGNGPGCVKSDDACPFFHGTDEELWDRRNIPADEQEALARKKILKDEHSIVKIAFEDFLVVRKEVQRFVDGNVKIKMKAALEKERLEEKERFALLPVFAGISPEDIVVIRDGNSDAASAALAHMRAMGVVGFDTESRPGIDRAETRLLMGPHLVQLAVMPMPSVDESGSTMPAPGASAGAKAYLFQLNPTTLPIVKEVLESPQILKIGFDLKSDVSLLSENHNVAHFRNVLDLACGRGKELCHLAYNNGAPTWSQGHILGLVRALGMVCGLSFHKDSDISRSDWLVEELSSKQQLYAANDAYGAAFVFAELARRGYLNGDNGHNGKGAHHLVGHHRLAHKTLTAEADTHGLDNPRGDVARWWEGVGDDIAPPPPKAKRVGK